MLAWVLAAALSQVPVSEHVTDTCNAGVCTRKIQNDLNYLDAADALQVSEDDVTSSGPYVWQGSNFQYRKRSRLTFYGGLLDAAGNNTTVGVTITNRPAIWFATRLVGAADVPHNVQDGRTLRWDEAMPNCAYYVRAGRKGIRNLLECTASPGQGYMEITFIMPSAAVITDTGTGWTLTGGGVTVRIDQGVVWDSANGNRLGLDFDGTPITSTTTLESNTVNGNIRTATWRVNPNNGQVSAAFGAGETVYVRLL